MCQVIPKRTLLYHEMSNKKLKCQNNAKKIMPRFLPPAGTLLAQASPGPKTCGTHATGWTNGTLPTIQGSTLDIQVTICY